MSRREVSIIALLLLGGFVVWGIGGFTDGVDRDEIPAAERRGGASGVFVDVGACPGEGCGYGTWTTSRPTMLRAAPDLSSRVVATVPVGVEVEAVSGEVHTVPGRFVVHRAVTTRLGNSYVPGDVLSVYTYRGEGFFLVERDGARYDEELGFSPWGGSPGTRCEGSELCWGQLADELDFTWWVFVRAATVEGWTPSDVFGF